jgi:hypothetical protein
MTLHKNDIMTLIADHLDPEEIIDRLEITSEELCELLEDRILANLEQFEDIYSETDFENDEEGC